MKCYHCGCELRSATIICPVCNRLQNQTLTERLVGYARELWDRRKSQPRRLLREY